ncbi:hypothetical protein KY285_023499 [Solanum tuberosum]|nr:hypothetical protein KY289_023832 [Solanum tuberosum]KAH0675698.1 hypothetical protein KY285_023499 [Solanum tuberosum]
MAERCQKWLEVALSGLYWNESVLTTLFRNNSANDSWILSVVRENIRRKRKRTIDERKEIERLPE